MNYHSNCATDFQRDIGIAGATLYQIKNAVLFDSQKERRRVVRLIPSKRSSGSSRFSLCPSWISFRAGVLDRASVCNMVSRFPFKFSISKPSKLLNVALVILVIKLFSKLNVFRLVNKWKTRS